jgi:hypothetical protein
MRLVVSDAATDLIRERGGRLYVTVKRARCCGGTRTLSTASEPPAGEFRLVPESDRFELYLPARLSPLPDELHVDVGGPGGRVAAFWNCCRWAV